jgi:hypothetical protein
MKPPVGLRQVGEGRSVVEAHVRVDDDLRAAVRGHRQGGADEHCEEQDGGAPRYAAEPRELRCTARASRNRSGCAS